MRINPTNVEDVKQVGKSLVLLGRHKAALDVFEEALRMCGGEHWELWHNKGVCYGYLRRWEDAKECFQRANAVQRHDCTYLQLGKILTQEEDLQGAIDNYLEALEFSPENPEARPFHLPVALVASCSLHLRLVRSSGDLIPNCGRWRSVDADNDRFALSSDWREHAGLRLSRQLAYARPKERENNPCGRLNHPGSLGHGRCPHQVPGRGGADTQFGAAVEQCRHVFLREGPARGSDCLPKKGALPRPLRVDRLLQPRPRPPHHGSPARPPPPPSCHQAHAGRVGAGRSNSTRRRSTTSLRPST